MCRLVVYKGQDPILLSHLLTRPAHSIINQAFASKLRLDLTRGPINGDGFGCAWYDLPETQAAEDRDRGEGKGGASCKPEEVSPCVFNAITPAWNNENLRRLADKVRSPLIFAHVRASTSGALSEQNCHPWSFGRFTWMHNGGISSFSAIKRRLQNALPEELFLFPQGSTDSEWCFALFLSFLPPGSLDGPTVGWEVLKDGMLRTIDQINTWTEEVGAEPSLMNFCVTDGESVVASRYVSSKTQEAASLFFSSGASFSADPDTPSLYHIPPSSSPPDPLVLIASEPLTFERSDWTEVHTNSLIVVTGRMNVLQIPIRDKYADDGTAGGEGRGRALVRGWGLATGYADEEGKTDPAEDEKLPRTIEVDGRKVEVTA